MCTFAHVIFIFFDLIKITQRADFYYEISPFFLALKKKVLSDSNKKQYTIFMLSDSKITEFFCMADDFCKFFNLSICRKGRWKTTTLRPAE